MRNNEIKDIFAKFPFRDEAFEELDIFLSAKEQYLEDGSEDNSIVLTMAYENIYLSIKHSVIEERIRETDFHYLVKLLKDEEVQFREYPPEIPEYGDYENIGH